MKHGLIGLLVASLVIAVQLVQAHDGASGIVKQRMDAMKSMGDHAKRVGDIYKGKLPFEADVVRAAAESFKEHGLEMPSLFEDTDMSRHGSQTEASPAIWDNWQEFQSLSQSFVEDSERLAAVVSPAQLGSSSEEDLVRASRRAFFRVAKQCRACHKKFRVDRD